MNILTLRHTASSLRFGLIILAVGGFLTSNIALSQAIPANWTDDMPSMEQVEARIQGTDPTDTLERQVAVFQYLQSYLRSIKEARDYKGPYTAAESKLLTDYSKAENDLTQSYTKTHTSQEASAFNQKIDQYSMNNARGWIHQIEGPKAAAADRANSASLNASSQKMYNQHMQDLQQAQQAQQQAASQQTAMVNGQARPMSNDPTSVAIRRCLELGGSTGSCMGGGLIDGMIRTVTGGEGLGSLTGPGRAGVVLSGAYHGGILGGAYVNFSGDSGALANCGKLVPDSTTYTLSKTAAALKVTLPVSPSPVVLTMGHDGSLQGPGAITLNGQIITGYHIVTTTRTGNCAPNCVTSTQIPIYAPATDRCTVGALAAPPPPPPPSANGSGPAAPGGLLGGVLDTLTGVMTATGTLPSASVLASPPGLRMEGKYTSSGLLLDFAGDAVTIDCGQAHVKSPYTVENAASSLIVHVQNPGGPFDLVVSSDNSLRGSGSTAINGKLVSGMNGTDITFTPHSETCQVGSYTPQTGSGSTTMVASNASPAPVAAAVPSTTARPATPTASGSGGSAITLSITSSFSSAKNPLAGRVVKLMTERFDNVLRKAGAPVPAGTTPGKALQAYTSGCPPPTGCPAAAQQMKQYYIGTATFDNNGSATLSAPVQPGSYYVFCAAPDPKGGLVWDMPLTLKAGQNNTINLTATNAELVPNQ